MTPKKLRSAAGWKLRWPLLAIDMLVLLVVQLFLLVIYADDPRLDARGVILEVLIAEACIMGLRTLLGIYRSIWRYGSIQSYMRLSLADLIGGVLYLLLERFVFELWIPFDRVIAICAMNLLFVLLLRMVYRYAYMYAGENSLRGKLLATLLRLVTGARLRSAGSPAAADVHSTQIAIIGAGSVGIALAQELLSIPAGTYTPRCFVDVSASKVGRTVLDIPVLMEDDSVYGLLREMRVSDVVFALPNISEERRRELFSKYLGEGFKIRIYDYPVIQTEADERRLREFDVEDLLFRKPVRINTELTSAYYSGKIILLTGGGGSIGAELARRIASMSPKQLILLDIYENGVYDVQQELRMRYGDALDLCVEIASITSRPAMQKILAAYRPDILINAAAHKHVPLMEHNCIEAVENNVFGTRTLVELCEQLHIPRFMMLSTDKAVNPTNVMGATKRMCEMLILSASARGSTVYSATRFGNVLDSAGSVIPLFKRQIAAGGPITLTDKRITRYFMTIPEAAQLVLESGAMAKNGELFVLDMSEPVRILDLAQNMIKLSGARGIKIVETGLRPGEKLYEELLVRPGELERTSNNLIFIEREAPLPVDEIEHKLRLLREACDSGDETAVRELLGKLVPTYRSPDEVNAGCRDKSASCEASSSCRQQ